MSGLTIPWPRPLLHLTPSGGGRLTERRAVERLIPRVDERALFLGRTGSGKTTLAVTMLALLGERGERLLIHSAKSQSTFRRHLPDAAQAATVDDLPALWQAGFQTIIYEPSGAELADEQTQDDWCEWVYQLAAARAYIDELNAITQSHRPKRGLLDLLARGRAREVRDEGGRYHLVHAPVWYGVQRAAYIPRQVETEADWLFVFALADLSDRRRVAEFAGPAVLQPPSRRYGFIAVNVARELARDMPPVDPRIVRQIVADRERRAARAEQEQEVGT